MLTKQGTGSFVLRYLLLLRCVMFLYRLYCLIVFCPVFSGMNQREWHCVF